MRKKVVRVEGVIGYQHNVWNVQEDVRREDMKYWAQKQTPQYVNTYKPAPFKLSEAAKVAFGRSIHFINGLRKV